jgi:hypothetical protein
MPNEILKIKAELEILTILKICDKLSKKGTRWAKMMSNDSIIISKFI